MNKLQFFTEPIYRGVLRSNVLNLRPSSMKHVI